jgi:hypothetical protein
MTEDLFFLGLRDRCAAIHSKLRDVRARGRRGLEVVFFAYEELLQRSIEGVSSEEVTEWVQMEQGRLRRELLEFPRVDQYGVLLGEPEEEEEERGVEGKVASVVGEEEAEGSRKGKEKARDQ